MLQTFNVRNFVADEKALATAETDLGNLTPSNLQAMTGEDTLNQDITQAESDFSDYPTFTTVQGSTITNDLNVVAADIDAVNADFGDTTSTQIPTPLLPPKVQPRTILDRSGNGSLVVGPFTVSGDWTLHYSYSCAAYGSAGNFSVDVINPNGTPSTGDTGPNLLSTSGSGSVPEGPDQGSYSLQVISECDWTVAVVGQS